jgi:hypothetical protein
MGSAACFDDDEDVLMRRLLRIAPPTAAVEAPIRVIDGGGGGVGTDERWSSMLNRLPWIYIQVEKNIQLRI